MRATLKLVVTAALAATIVAGHRATASTVDIELAGRKVTLLTGDRVTVLADGAFAVEHGPGRDGMTFQTKRVGGHLSVIPADATEPLAAGRLDPRLFDVTTLLAFGYDDRRADLPLIITGGDHIEGAAVDRRLPRLGAVAARQDRRVLAGAGRQSPAEGVARRAA